MAGYGEGGLLAFYAGAVDSRINAALEKKRLRDQQRDLVRRFATSEVAQDMQQSGFALGGRRVQGSVMFSDIRGFTRMSEGATAGVINELLNDYFELMVETTQTIFDPHGRSTNICDGLTTLADAQQSTCAHVELWPTAYRFRRGHRMRVQVSSGAHPVYARNLGTGEPPVSGVYICMAPVPSCG